MTEKVESKEIKANKEREEKAEKFNTIVLNSLTGIRRGTLALACAMKQIRDDELFIELDYDNFSQYCSSPEICLKPSTIDKYIRIYEYWIEEKKKKLEDLSGIAINKLELIQDLKNPEKYFHEAETMPFKDFRKLIMDKEHGIKADDKEIEDFISRKQSSCPHWDPEKKKCKIGKDSDLKGHKEPETDDLI